MLDDSVKQKMVLCHVKFAPWMYFSFPTGMWHLIENI